jgi:hypothetical protein
MFWDNSKPGPSSGAIWVEPMHIATVKIRLKPVTIKVVIYLMACVIYIVKIYTSKNGKNVGLDYCNTEFQYYNKNYK